MANHAQHIAITGATGFIGRQMVERMLEAPSCRVTAFYNRSLPNRAEDARVQWKTTSDILAQEATALKNVDAVVHLAARAHILDRSRNDLELFREINAEFPLQVAQAAARQGVRRLVFASTIGVLGTRTDDAPFSASDPPAPQEPYAMAKHEAELRLREYESVSGLEVVIVRPPLVYGPGAPGNFQRLLRAISQNIPLPLAGIRNRRSFVGVRNLTDLLCLCTMHPSAAGKTFLAGDGEAISTPDLVRTLAAGLNRKPRLFSLPSAVLRTCLQLTGSARIFDQLAASLEVDITETCRQLSWQPAQPMRSGLGEMAEAFRNRSAKE